MGLLAGGAEEEQLPRTGLISHNGYNSGYNRVHDAVQPSGGECHKNLAGHDGRGP